MIDHILESQKNSVRGTISRMSLHLTQIQTPGKFYKLSEQFEDYDQRVESETEEDRNSSEVENNTDSESEIENLRKEKQYWQVPSMAQLKSNQKKSRDLSKEGREEEAKTQELSSLYAEAAST